MIFGSHYAPIGLGSLEPGTHLCAVDQSSDALDRTAATFVGQGLSVGDQMLYVGTHEQSARLLSQLPRDVHADEALETGQLLVRTFSEAYGTERPSDLGAVADGFRAAAAESRKSGFPGLRVAARMDELAPLLGSVDEVVRWERMSTDLQREIRVSSVCLYDTAHLRGDQPARIAGAHQGVAPERVDSPIATFLPVDDPWGLRVSGEIDLSNRDLLHRLLLSRAAVLPRLRIDLAGVLFADVGALARLRDVAAALPEGGYVELDRVPAGVRRVLDLGGLEHDRLRLG
jgi:ABC-type transporter Mla MlaB component